MPSAATGQAGRGQRLTTVEEAARHTPYHALVERIAELDAYSHHVLHQFPKLERHLLCAEIRAAMNELARLLVVAWKRRQKIDFCGYRIWPTHILPRKRNMRRIRQRLRRAAHDYAGGRCTLGDVRAVVMSARAYCKHCSARTALRSTLSEIRL